VNSLPETVTRQSRGCDLNPGPTAPESSTLTTRLSRHPCGYVCVKDDRECIIYSHSSHFYTVSSHSFPLPFPSLCPIPIPIGFPLGYFHFSSDSQTRTAKQYRPIVGLDLNAISRQLSCKQTVSHKTGHQSLKNENSKNTIHSALTIRQKF